VSVKISVALCTYNGAAFLKEQLNSINQQTQLPDELVICDDNSFDHTLEIIDLFIKEAKFIVRVFRNEARLGSTQNFGKAISLCEGDIIFLADQDDYWYPEKIAVCERIFKENPGIGGVFSDAEMVDKQLIGLGYNFWESIGFNEKDQRKFVNGKATEVLINHNVVAGAALAFRAEMKRFFLPIPDIWVHDGWIALCIAVTSNVAAVPRTLYQYRQHSNQQIGGVKKGFLDQIKKDKREDLIESCRLGMECFELLLDRVKTISGLPEDIMNSIEGKIRHLVIRADLPKQRLWRFPIICSELLKLNYKRYTSGLVSALKDFVL
jgi:glycosyltransferase involved in cell wall biosynthesis